MFALVFLGCILGFFGVAWISANVEGPMGVAAYFVICLARLLTLVVAAVALILLFLAVAHGLTAG